MKRARQVYKLGKKQGVSTLTPNAFDVKRLIRDKKEPAFMDETGRIYGLISDENKVLQGLKNSGDVDEESTFMFWINLPMKKKIENSNPRLKSARIENKDVKQGDVLLGEEMAFPNLGEEVTLYDFYTNGYVANMTVMKYPEKIRVNQKTTSIVMRLY